MNNVRDHCGQPDARKLLMFTLATYCNAEGKCFPSNETLAGVTRKSRRTVQRMIKQLAADGELEVLEPGVGRDTKRIIALKRYADAQAKGDKVVSLLNVTPQAKHDTQMSRLNVTDSLGKTYCNNHVEQPTNEQPTKDARKGSHTEFVRLWCERFKAINGDDYKFAGGKDGKAAKTLLETTRLRPAELISIAEEAWKRPRGFWCKLSTSIAGYNSHFNEIRKEIKDGMENKTSDRDAGKLARARRSQYAGIGRLQ